MLWKFDNLFRILLFRFVTQVINISHNLFFGFYSEVIVLFFGQDRDWVLTCMFNFDIFYVFHVAHWKFFIGNHINVVINFSWYIFAISVGWNRQPRYMNVGGFRNLRWLIMSDCSNARSLIVCGSTIMLNHLSLRSWVALVQVVCPASGL